jgi:hypothetical protein
MCDLPPESRPGEREKRLLSYTTAVLSLKLSSLFVPVCFGLISYFLSQSLPRAKSPLSACSAL